MVLINKHTQELVVLDDILTTPVYSEFGRICLGWYETQAGHVAKFYHFAFWSPFKEI